MDCGKTEIKFHGNDLYWKTKRRTLLGREKQSVKKSKDATQQGV